jgi:hypothetical protein
VDFISAEVSTVVTVIADGAVTSRGGLMKGMDLTLAVGEMSLIKAGMVVNPTEVLVPVRRHWPQTLLLITKFGLLYTYMC